MLVTVCVTHRQNPVVEGEVVPVVGDGLVEVSLVRFNPGEVAWGIVRGTILFRICEARIGRTGDIKFARIHRWVA